MKKIKAMVYKVNLDLIVNEKVLAKVINLVYLADKIDKIVIDKKEVEKILRNK